jgi:hypothetical protein
MKVWVIKKIEKKNWGKDEKVQYMSSNGDFEADSKQQARKFYEKEDAEIYLDGEKRNPEYDGKRYDFAVEEMDDGKESYDSFVEEMNTVKKIITMFIIYHKNGERHLTLNEYWPDEDMEPEKINVELADGVEEHQGEHERYLEDEEGNIYLDRDLSNRGGYLYSGYKRLGIAIGDNAWRL